MSISIGHNKAANPTNMAAGKIADIYGLAAGNGCETSDAEQAYVQADLRGPDTWVLLPEDQWPKSWKSDGYVCPVVRHKKALYGHPDSGTVWERHCESKLKEIGFEPVTAWASTFWHEELKLLLLPQMGVRTPVHSLGEGPWISLFEHPAESPF